MKEPWCSYCQTGTHADAQCSRTRLVDWKPHAPTDYSRLFPQGKFPIQTTVAQPCHCTGPRHGEPRCPCQMRSVIKRDGRWIQTEVDLGPAI